jgi:hypothetical protein
MMLTKRCVADRQKLVEPLRCSPSRSATVRSKTPDRVHRGAPAAQRRHERSVREVFGIYKIGPGDGGGQGATRADRRHDHQVQATKLVRPGQTPVPTWAHENAQRQ